MARKAREKIPFGTYLVQQFCIENKVLFESDMDRRIFLEICLEKKAQFHFKVYGYCLSDERSYKIVIYDNGSDISKIMKSINISYAYRLKERGKIFKDRYKSTLLKSPEDLQSVLDAISGEKPCCDFKTDLTGKLLDGDLYFTPEGGKRENLVTFDSNTKKPCLDDGPSCKNRTDCVRSVPQGNLALEKAAERQGLTVEQLLANKQLRNRELLKLRKMTTLSLREIGEIFGGLGESSVCKIISRNKEK
ncbi:MAG TPA: hypothetical protein VJ990_00120 [Clostridia bacterium]|nr:hypothetical protein [Clostridia bacterium]